MPLLTLHSGASDAPLAVAPLPVSRLARAADGATFDGEVDLGGGGGVDGGGDGSGGGGGGGGASARLGVFLSVRERDPSELQRRDTDPRVCFLVRLRLLSLTLLRPPGPRLPPRDQAR